MSTLFQVVLVLLFAFVSISLLRDIVLTFQSYRRVNLERDDEFHNDIRKLDFIGNMENLKRTVSMFCVYIVMMVLSKGI